MADLFFYAFATFTVACAAAVVGLKNTVASALALLLCLVGVAGIFILLDAFLLAALMVFVYAGAVVALFLFIIMLLDAHGGDRKSFKKSAYVSGGLAAALLALMVVSAYKHGGQTSGELGAAVMPVGATLKNYGEQLFTTYLLPVQIVGFLLLIAMLGVIVLSKKFEGLEDVK
ncbi:MAG TPA: NADH-quinone oxidoreductase subunit J [Rariglobus sp.]|jgi:NADH-quinone oxidoreductase subunit J|nr:NADH-quinone oxidoreductase subunit J [Rariglobus sp.]